MKNQKKQIQKLKLFILLFFLLIFYITISAFNYVSSVSTNLSDGLLRLHVVANSNSEADQNLKYKVRDSLLNYMSNLCENTTDKNTALNIIADNLENFKNIAEQTILENGFSYSVNISLGNYEFPTKHYQDISLPSGMYDALKVEIGSGVGENWWCVMFPPLCFTTNPDGILSSNSSDILETNLSNEEYTLISDDDSPSVSFKFKLLELFSTL